MVFPPAFPNDFLAKFSLPSEKAFSLPQSYLVPHLANASGCDFRLTANGELPKSFASFAPLREQIARSGIRYEPFDSGNDAPSRSDG